MKKKKIIISLLICSIIASLVGLFYVVTLNSKQNKIDVVDTEEIVEEKKYQPERQLWLENKAISDDYIGEIVFDSNLINISFVQANDVYDKQGNLYRFYKANGQLVNDVTDLTGNDVYMYTNWTDMSYDYNILGGSIFLDYRNNLNDQNIIIYGHHFSVAGGNDPERVKAFTPLEKLLEAENYPNNSTLRLILDNETRTYELAATYIYDIYNEEHNEKLQYYRCNYNYDEFNDIYDENYYQIYLDEIEKVKLYDTDTTLNTSDKTLTLQTCISGQDGLQVQICVFKLIDSQYYQD